MDPALLRRVHLPPPAAVPRRLAGRNRPGARLAADRGVAPVVQRVVGDIALTDVLPDLLLRPLGERVELDDRAVIVVDLDLADVGAGRPLVAAKAGDPRVERREMLRQRLDLADVAAEQPLLDLAVEEVRAVPAGHRLHLPRIGGEKLEIEA